MMARDYKQPVSKLLELGDCWNEPWMDYTELGIGPEHVPELIRLALDEELYLVGSDSDLSWAGVHAWRALAQLRAAEAAEPLTRVLRYIDEYDDDCASEELPEVFGRIGPAAIPVLADYAADPDNPLFARVAAAQGLVEIGAQHPDVCPDCVAALTGLLEGFAEHDLTLNAFLIAYLMDLDAVEAAPLIERAFEAGRVDVMVVGDWGDVQVDLGLEEAGATTGGPMAGFNFPDLEEANERERAQERLQEIGRNDPCWCGSGRKYKHCHLREDQQKARA